MLSDAIRDDDESFFTALRSAGGGGVGGGSWGWRHALWNEASVCEAWTGSNCSKGRYSAFSGTRAGFCSEGPGPGTKDGRSNENPEEAAVTTAADFKPFYLEAA